MVVTDTVPALVPPPVEFTPRVATREVAKEFVRRPAKGWTDDAGARAPVRPPLRRLEAAKTAGLLPVALLIALGSALTLGSMLGQERPREAQPAHVGQCEMNRDIERRLDLAVNGPSPLSPTPKPCPSPEPRSARP